MSVARPEKNRIDKWLWQARFFKTRGLAADMIRAGHMRVNGHKKLKPSTVIGPGDVLTFVQAERVRVIEVRNLATRRGPASEATLLYLDRSPPLERDMAQKEPPIRSGRPSKKDRQIWTSLSRGTLE